MERPYPSDEIPPRKNVGYPNRATAFAVLAGPPPTIGTRFPFRTGIKSISASPAIHATRLFCTDVVCLKSLRKHIGPLRWCGDKENISHAP